MAQIMNLNEEIIPAGCKVKYTQRVYFKKYRTKLVFEIDKTKLIKAPNNSNMSYWGYRHQSYLNRRELMTDLINRVKRAIPENADFRFRSEHEKISFFTNDIETIENLLVACSTRVIEIEHPMNDRHADVIDNHRKVIVRETLFNKFYKFKVYLKYNYHKRLERYAELNEYLEESSLNWAPNTALDRLFSTQRSIKFIGHTLAIYLNDPDDLMIFQLKYNDDILKIEEIVLLKDLKQ
jgi:hypothetical protein